MSDSPAGPPITSVGAQGTVTNQFATASSWGDRAISAGISALTSLSGFEVSPLNFGVQPITGDFSFTLTKPQQPEMPDIGVDVGSPPTEPSFPTITDPDIGDPPSDIGGAPSLNFSSKPTPTKPSKPGDPPELLDVREFIPERPDEPFPELPTLEQLNLPEPPVVFTHGFDGERPVNDLEAPEDFAINRHQIGEYSSDLLDELQQEVSRMLKGGTGLPPAIEQMIFDRSRVREDDQAERVVMETVDEWASRGFSMPSGVLNKRLERVRQENQRQQNAHNRELTIRVHEVEIENLRFAIEQGIALENLLSNIFIQLEQMSLQLAQIATDILLNAFRVKVELYNAEVNAYRVDAEVYREKIRAELAKVEIYRAEIEAERVKGEVNQQKIDIYRSQLDAINTMVSIYSTEMQAAQTVAQINETKFRGFAAEIQAYTAQVEAMTAEYNAWQAEIEGELGKVRGYEAEARAFSARASAFASGAEAKTIVPRFKVEEMRATADKFRAQLAGYQSEIEAERVKVQSLAEAYRAKASIYSSDAQIYAAEVGAEEASSRLGFESVRAKAELGVKANEVKVQQAIALSGQQMEALRGAAQAAAGLAGSAMSAVQATAQITEQGSAMNQWSSSYSLQERRDLNSGSSGDGDE